MKFTEDEISLCGQVAERYRKKIGEGDWYISKDSDYKAGWSPPLLNEDDYEPIKSKLVGIYDDKDRIDIPLWTIFDCLEFLREKGWLLSSFIERLKEPKISSRSWKPKVSCMFWKPRKSRFALSPDYEGGCGYTPLEACLKAVLAVLEEVRR